MISPNWSEWRPFPDPRNEGILTAPFGAGCYELRHRKGRLVLFGTGAHIAYRMTSLLPEPLGEGTRHNAAKRAFVLEHLHDIEYRTVACATPQKAKALEKELKASNNYIFPT